MEFVDRYTLIAVDPDGIRREWPLSSETYTVGREPSAQFAIAVPGDRHLSREHFQLLVGTHEITVVRLESGRNPIYFDGEQCERFTLQPGQVFYTGKTQFGVMPGRGATATTHYALAKQAKEDARLRRLQDCFSAVLNLLQALRSQSATPAWQVAFPVLKEILPEVSTVAFLQLHGDSGVYRVIDKDPIDSEIDVNPEILRKAIDSQQTVAEVSEEFEVSRAIEGTLNPSYPWSVLTPIAGLEERLYLFYASGVGSLSRDALTERATLVDLVGEMVGHHIVVQQGSEYSNLLGVFGHQIGTLFKTSGVLPLWADPKTPKEVKRVLDRLLPVWGISQAISLHKKRGERARKELLSSWVRTPTVDIEEIEESLVRLISQAYHSPSETPFLPWLLNGEPIPEFQGLTSLPPLDDVEQILDKTLAVSVGLLEVLTNIRKYPSSRGDDREDREDLMELPVDERVVRVSVSTSHGVTTVTIVQPVVTAADGRVPRSRSVERIRALEQSMLGGLVGTRPERVIGPTRAPNVVLVKHQWSYNYGQLLEDWQAHHDA